MCVRFKQEEGKNAKWSRWQIVPKHHGNKPECGGDKGGYVTAFTFKSMRDVHQAPWIQVCAWREKNGLHIVYDCSAQTAIRRPALVCWTNSGKSGRRQRRTEKQGSNGGQRHQWH